jgi:hypothetical protein
MGTFYVTSPITYGASSADLRGPGTKNNGLAHRSETARFREELEQLLEEESAHDKRRDLLPQQVT